MDYLEEEPFDACDEMAAAEEGRFLGTDEELAELLDPYGEHEADYLTDYYTEGFMSRLNQQESGQEPLVEVPADTYRELVAKALAYDNMHPVEPEELPEIEPFGLDEVAADINLDTEGYSE